MKFLDNITMVIVDTFKHDRALEVIRRSLEQIDVPKVKFFTDKQIKCDYEIINIPTITDKKQYSRFMIKDLNKFIDTEFVLTVQWDGYVLNGEAWDETFLNYDYIGSPWPWHNNQVGNGGFSLRSKKLLEICSNKKLKIIHPEDHIICKTYRNQMKEWGIKFAPFEVANRFSIEIVPYDGQFGYHNHRGICVKIKDDIKWVENLKDVNR